MATMKDIANKAGVSQATVSRVMSDSSSVSQKTKAMVMEWVRKLDFEPNYSARALASSRSYLICLVLPDVMNPYFADIIYHVEKIASFNGFNILLCNSDGDPKREVDILKSLKSRQVDGVLIGFSDNHSPAIKILRDSELPTVVITQFHEDFDCVAVDHYAGGEMAARHFMDQGAEYFIYQGHTDDDKFRGYYNTLKDAGIPEDRLDIMDLGHVWYHTPQRAHKAYRRALEYLQNRKYDSKTGVFSYNDLSAFGFIHAVQDMHLTIPEQYSIVGFDDTFMCQVMRPTLTSIAQPKEEIGQLAIKYLLAKIDKKVDTGRESFLLTPRLVQRETT